MKNKILKASLLVLFLSVIVSCSSDDDSGSNYTKENFMEGYLATTGFNQSTTNFINSGYYEFGLEFTPLVKGKITDIRVKLPDANASLRVTFWNKETGAVIRTEVVNVASAGAEFVVAITDIELLKDKQYAITMNSNDWYNREKLDGTNAVYPVASGNIQIDAYRWGSGTSQTYPVNNSADYYAGDLSFDFIQTN